MKSCPHCATDTVFGSIYCEECGEPLFLTTPPQLSLVIGNHTISHEPPLSILLGRDPTPAAGFQVIPLDQYSQGDMGVSRNHAIIYLDNSKFFIKDTDSTNGTWINMNKINSQEFVEIQDNDIITLATIEIRVIIRKR